MSMDNANYMKTNQAIRVTFVQGDELLTGIAFAAKAVPSKTEVTMLFPVIREPLSIWAIREDTSSFELEVSFSDMRSIANALDFRDIFEVNAALKAQIGESEPAPNAVNDNVQVADEAGSITPTPGNVYFVTSNNGTVSRVRFVRLDNTDLAMCELLDREHSPMVALSLTRSSWRVA